MSRVDTIFSPEGPIAETMARYERRPSQAEMATAVEAVIRNGGVLLAEAGTGTGKTLAYLVPAVLSERTTIISTGTKNLQEQIFFKDIAFLSRALGRPIDAVYLKGQDNYLCLRRLRDFLRSPAVLAYRPKQIEALRRFADTTETGDRTDMEGLGDGDPIWREVCSTKDTRIGVRCPFHEDCFVTRARLRAAQARIVVVNHHLYFADMATRLKGGALLPTHDLAVFDEAHGIENVATEFFSTTASSRQAERLVTDVTATLRAARLADDPGEDRRDRLGRNLLRASAEFFDLFQGPPGRERLVPEALDPDIVQVYFRLDSAFEAFEASLRMLEGRDEAVDHVRERFTEIRDDLAAIVTESSRGFVHWVENRKRSVIIGASPIDVSEPIRDGVFFSVPSVVLTSATLSTGGDFSFLKSRIGIDFDATELTVPSPFDYRRQACLFVPADLPDPRDGTFAERAADIAEALIAMTAGGALLLSTSHRNMQAFHRLLQGRVPGGLLRQGELPKRVLLNEFMADPKSVLVATTSFWQGVDIPGDALRLVIIDKLPFSAPNDPLEAARIAHLTEAGQNAFMTYQVPAAALLLKQGFGRLIRTGEDRGVVAILDHRLRTKRYAGVFWRSLPPCPRVDTLAAVEAWWRQGPGAAHPGG